MAEREQKKRPTTNREEDVVEEAAPATSERADKIKAELPRLQATMPAAIKIFTLSDRVKDNPTLPQGLIGREIRGLLIGPWLYLKGRRRIPA